MMLKAGSNGTPPGAAIGEGDVVKIEGGGGLWLVLSLGRDGQADVVPHYQPRRVPARMLRRVGETRRD